MYTFEKLPITRAEVILAVTSSTNSRQYLKVIYQAIASVYHNANLTGVSEIYSTMFLSYFGCLLRLPPFSILFFAMIFTCLCNAIEDTQKSANRNGGLKWIKVHTQWGCSKNVCVHARVRGSNSRRFGSDLLGE